MKCLIKLGADISRLDGEGNGMVNLAAMRFHTNVLEYLIEWGHQKAPVWKILVSKYFLLMSACQSSECREEKYYVDYNF